MNGIEKRYDKRNYKKDRDIGRFIGRIETERRDKERLNFAYKLDIRPMAIVTEPRQKIIDTQTLFNFDYKHHIFDEPISKVFITDNNYKEPQPNKYKTIDDIGLQKTSVETGFNTFIDERDWLDDDGMRNIRTIHNVYQERYTGTMKATGFGDFIRGCYYLLDFCDRNGKELVITVNHTISRFLKATQQVVEDDKITFFLYNNCESHIIDDKQCIHTRTGTDVDERFIKYIAHLANRIRDKVYVYNIVYPSHEISELHKERIRSFLEPTQNQTDFMNFCLSQLQLEPKKYNVVHIRSGDKYITGRIILKNDSYIDALEYEISKIDAPVLIIADNKYVKKYLLERNDQLKMLFNEIIHFGEGFKQEYESVKNTMLDFQLIANAKSVLSLSCYEHGSGFSQWCATTYNIPYNCKNIKPIQ